MKMSSIVQGKNEKQDDSSGLKCFSFLIEAYIFHLHISFECVIELSAVLKLLLKFYIIDNDFVLLPSDYPVSVHLLNTVVPLQGRVSYLYAYC